MLVSRAEESVVESKTGHLHVPDKTSTTGDEQTGEKTSCCICLENEATLVNDTCNHKYFCDECTDTFIESGADDRCPMCRQCIKEFTRPK